LVAVLGCVPASAQAAVVAGTSVTFPSSAFGGDTGLPASITLRNLNTGTDSGVANGVCNADDVGLPCATPEPGITLVPACRQVDAGGCLATAAAPGVFAVSPRATGRAGSACAGMTFTTAIVDPAVGTVRFSPPAGTRIVLVKGTSCEIDFTVDVLKGPGDRNPTTFGGDIRQVTSHGQFGGPLDPASDSSRAQSSSLGFGTALFRGLPFLNASASPSATLGGQVSATATVVGRHNQLSGGTTDFRLYAPEDQACRSAPVFESLGVPYPADGGAVASQAFAPDRAGLYRWVVTYSGDVGNFPAISMCGGTNVIVRAPSQATPSQPPPPTCSGRTATIVASPGQRHDLRGCRRRRRPRWRRQGRPARWRRPRPPPRRLRERPDRGRRRGQRPSRLRSGAGRQRADGPARSLDALRARTAVEVTATASSSRPAARSGG
jgi:hypothetical protein